MRSSHTLDRPGVAFDDARLVADAGLLLPATLAAHLGLRELVEYAALAEPASSEAHALRAEIYDARAAAETFSMSRGIFIFAADSSRHGKRDGFEP